MDIGFESKQFPNFGTLIDKTKILVPNLKQSIPEALFMIGGGWREKESNDLKEAQGTWSGREFSSIIIFVTIPIFMWVKLSFSTLVYSVLDRIVDRHKIV